jgi:hypothetical protein
MKELGLGEEAAWRSATLIKILAGHARWHEVEISGQTPGQRVLESLLKDGEVHQFLQVNRHNEILWFNKEAFEELLGWLFWVAVVEISSDPQRPASQITKDLEGCYNVYRRLSNAEKKSDYQVERLIGEVNR